jgi:molybdopterin-guanine dinucleotide biosynthesis protein A
MRIAAAIIAGGKATRLGGVAKGMLRDSGGMSIIEKLLTEIAAAGVTEVVISANSPEPFVELNLPIIADRHADIGPLGGIEAVLSALAPLYDCVLLLPCDLPNVTRDEILTLVRSYEETPGRVVVAHSAEGDHPLCAVVPVSVLRAANAAVAAGEYGVGRLWRSLDARPVVIDDESRLLNINTPEDMQTWRGSAQPTE